MVDRNQFDLLDSAIDALLALPNGERVAAVSRQDPELGALLNLAAELRRLPSEHFKVQLKQDLARRSKMATTAPKLEQPYSEPRPTASPYLTFEDAAAALDFYARAFGAVELSRIAEPNGRIGHAEIRIGNSHIMLSDEYPDYGSLSPQTIGGSPVKIHLSVPNVDEFVATAVKAGAKLQRQVADQFYGARSGQVADPFGYQWTVATQIEKVSPEEIARRFAEMSAGAPAHKGRVRPGFNTVTPYIIVSRADLAIDFIKQAFGAEEMFRDVGSAGGYHCELRLEDEIFMIGGGAPNLAWRGESRPMAFHIYVQDADAAYSRALAAGAASIDPPRDQPYGERSSTVEDPSGNRWYIARMLGGGDFKPPGVPVVQPYFHPLRATPFIRFLKNAFGAKQVEYHETPAGEVLHAAVMLGTSRLEMGEATTRYSNQPGTFYLYVEDADALYHRAIAAGATSLHEPADQPYGDRNAGVSDPFGNSWYIGTQLTKTSHP